MNRPSRRPITRWLLIAAVVGAFVVLAVQVNLRLLGAGESEPAGTLSPLVERTNTTGDTATRRRTAPATSPPSRTSPSRTAPTSPAESDDHGGDDDDSGRGRGRGGDEAESEAESEAEDEDD